MQVDRRDFIARDQSGPYEGLGSREVELGSRGARIAIEQLPVVKRDAHDARSIRADSAAAPAVVGDRWRAGLAGSGVIPTLGKDDLRFTGYGGNGIGRYNVPRLCVDGVIDPSGRIDLPRITGGCLACRHFWNSDLRSSRVSSASQADNPAGTFGTINKRDRPAHVNLIGSAWKNADIGIEYIHAQRRAEDGQDGSLNRVQFSAKYAS
jgi:hypothetical protein